MRFVAIAPPPALALWVEQLWWYECDGVGGRERVLPSGRGQILVNLAEDALRTYDRDGRRLVASTRGAAIVAPSQGPVGIDAGEQRSIVGVTARAGGLHPFLDVPVDVLDDVGLELPDAWGREGALVRERLLEAGDPHHILETLGAVLIERLATARAKRAPGLATARPLQVALASLERGTAVREVVAASGLSESTFLRRFRALVGMTPKRWARVRRLQRVLEAIEGMPAATVDWARVAAEQGYRRTSSTTFMSSRARRRPRTARSRRACGTTSRSDGFLQSAGGLPRQGAGMTKTSIIPRLVVKDAQRALAWYVEALGAREVARFTAAGGTVVHAEIAIEDARVYLVEEQRGWHNHAPSSLGGSPVLLALTIDDVDGVAARMERAGARVIFPIADQFYGERGGRLEDPFGHVWMISRVIEELTPEEMQRRMDSFGG